MNWMAINIDAKKIEKICHGVVPGPSDNLKKLKDTIHKIERRSRRSRRVAGPI